MKKINNNKIIFMGTPLVASNYLRILLENNYNIISVFTQPARKKNRGLKTQISEVEQVAKQNNILIHSPEKFDEKSLKLDPPQESERSEAERGRSHQLLRKIIS